MKYFKILSILLLSSVITIYACKQESKASTDVSDSPALSNDAIQNPATAEPAQNAAGVWHYTCAKGCKGGAGGAGNCGTCGGALAHNTAYHQ